MIVSWEESDYFWKYTSDTYKHYYFSTSDCSTVQRFLKIDWGFRTSKPYDSGRLVWGVRQFLKIHSFAYVICNTKWHVQICSVKVAILSAETSKSSAPNFLFRSSTMNCSTLQRFWRVHCWISFRSHTFGVGEALVLLFAYVICNTKWHVAFTPTKHKSKLKFRGAEKWVIRQYNVFGRLKFYENASW